MARVPNNRVTNEAQQNPPIVAKMTSHLPILQIKPGMNMDKHAMTTAATSALLASDCVTTFPVGGGSVMTANEGNTVNRVVKI
jgi:hypothetical protein